MPCRCIRFLSFFFLCCLVAFNTEKIDQPVVRTDVVSKKKKKKDKGLWINEMGREDVEEIGLLWI